MRDWVRATIFRWSTVPPCLLTLCQFLTFYQTLCKEKTFSCCITVFQKDSNLPLSWTVHEPQWSSEWKYKNCFRYRSKGLLVKFFLWAEGLRDRLFSALRQVCYFRPLLSRFIYGVIHHKKKKCSMIVIDWVTLFAYFSFSTDALI